MGTQTTTKPTIADMIAWLDAMIEHRCTLHKPKMPEAIRDTLTALQANPVPDGWKLVPPRIDYRMKRVLRNRQNGDTVQNTWTKVLAAAPSPPNV